MNPTPEQLANLWNTATEGNLRDLMEYAKDEAARTKAASFRPVDVMGYLINP